MPNSKLQQSFWGYLRAFGQNWLTLMSGSLSVLLLIATTFVSYWNKVGLFLLAAACVNFASFRIWLNQQKEIARLRLRPYDEAQQGFVRGILGPLGLDERDVLRYLVRFGECEQQRLYADAGIDATEFGRILTRANETRLLHREERAKAGRASTDLFWRVNPQFVEVLKDELFPRREETLQRCFSAATFDLPRQTILTDKLQDRKTEGSEQRSKKEQPSRLQKMVFGILGLLIVVGSLVVKEIFRDRYKDSVEAINSAKAMFLLKNDTTQILGTVWELANEPKPRRPGEVVRFTITAPVPFDTKAFFDSVSSLIEKLPDSDELNNRVKSLRSRNDQFNKDSEKLYRVFSQHVVFSDPHRVDLTFDNYRDEMEFSKAVGPHQRSKSGYSAGNHCARR